MKHSKAALDRIHSAVRRILRRDWNPLHLGVDAPEDEYDAYAWLMTRLVMEGHNAPRIEQELHRLEETELELNPVARTALRPVRHRAAARLVALHSPDPNANDPTTSNPTTSNPTTSDPASSDPPSHEIP